MNFGNFFESFNYGCISNVIVPEPVPVPNINSQFKVNWGFLNSKSTDNEKGDFKKSIIQYKHIMTRKNRRSIRNAIYDEMRNLPLNLDNAVITRQNLTLKQILVLMNLHAIPGIALNVIHDKIQHKVQRTMVKIFHDNRVFYISQYYWYDLKYIELMINDMFN